MGSISLYHTFAVLKMTFLQSGRMLTDQAGRAYKFPLNDTFASKLWSMLARNAAQPAVPL